MSRTAVGAWGAPPAGRPRRSVVAPSTVVRFITGRNPRKPKEDDLRRNFVFYDDAIAAPLVRAAREAWPDGRRAVYDRIRQFTATNAYLATPAQLRAAAGDLVDLGEWMIAHEGALTVASLEHRI